MIFRRKGADKKASDESPEHPDDLAELKTDRPRGPWDRAETAADDADGTYVDLGGLLVKGAPSLELRLQVDEQTSAVAAVLLAGPESGLELRAFAAPRSSGIWADVRDDIAAEAVKHGGTVTELDGEYGTELKVVVPVQLPDGRAASQASRIVGVEGPRWLLRGTFLGRSALDPDPEGPLETAFRQVIVVRGTDPMAP
ncbi:MAG: DUF3710 domain-containing protein, partial [Propionibacteriales bacterium]|nr:DUF3710 domain-containing protein [Propionibacteriales bacterium]